MDVVIAIAMTILVGQFIISQMYSGLTINCQLLRAKQNNGTGNGRSLSSALVNRLIFFVIETGTMTGVYRAGNIVIVQTV